MRRCTRYVGHCSSACFHSRYLVGHEGAESLDLVGVHVERVADASLAGGAVVRVLRAVAGDDLDGAVVPLHGEGHFQHVRTGFHDPEDSVHL